MTKPFNTPDSGLGDTGLGSEWRQGLTTWTLGRWFLLVFVVAGITLLATSNARGQAGSPSGPDREAQTVMEDQLQTLQENDQSVALFMQDGVVSHDEVQSRVSLAERCIDEKTSGQIIRLRFTVGGDLRMKIRSGSLEASVANEASAEECIDEFLSPSARAYTLTHQPSEDEMEKFDEAVGICRDQFELVSQDLHECLDAAEAELVTGG